MEHGVLDDDRRRAPCPRGHALLCPLLPPRVVHSRGPARPCQHQQLQLSLKNLSMQALWPQIESVKTLTSKEVLNAEEHHLWSVLEKLSDQKQVRIKLNKEEKTVTSFTLMLALEKYKTLIDGTNK